MTTQNKTNVKRKIFLEYYILAGITGMKEKLIEADLELSPVYFMVVKENSEIGKLIKKEAKKRINKSKMEKDK